MCVHYTLARGGYMQQNCPRFFRLTICETARPPGANVCYYYSYCYCYYEFEHQLYEIWTQPYTNILEVEPSNFLRLGFVQHTSLLRHIYVEERPALAEAIPSLERRGWIFTYIDFTRPAAESLARRNIMITTFFGRT